MKPGIYYHISNEDYHNGPGISKSGLDCIARSPLHYWARYLDPDRMPKKETPALRLGKAVHAANLEPERFKREYVREPQAEEFPGVLVDASDYKEACKKYGCPVSGTKPELKKRLIEAKADVEFFDDITAQVCGSKLVLSPGDWATCREISTSLRSHPTAKILFAEGYPEVSVFWTDPDTGVLCRCRPDWWQGSDATVVDVKSSLDASESGFQRTMISYRYWVQAAFYFDGMAAVGHPISDFVFAVWEKYPPYACGFYYVDGSVIELGRAEYKRLLKIYAECVDKNQWPGYGDLLKPLTMPSWFRVGDSRALEFREEEAPKDWMEELL